MKMLLMFITALLLSTIAEASFVSDDEAPDVVTCETQGDAKSTIGNFVSVSVIKNKLTHPIYISWISHLGHHVSFIEKIEAGKTQHIKFINGSYFVVSNSETDECIDVFKLKVKPQVIVYK